MSVNGYYHYAGAYLLDVGLSLRAMPCLGLCITAALGAVTGSGGRVACCLCHVVKQSGKGGLGKRKVVVLNGCRYMAE